MPSHGRPAPPGVAWSELRPGGLSFVNDAFAPAYCVSKRGHVDYSDTLRYEVAQEVAATTIYPGYVKTAIHRHAHAAGFALEGMVPDEHLDDVAARVARAALTDRE